ncbi:MAG TPA: C25 family cysteine peptidase, partial [Blastocatellia bacterium]|nr:C25 family cysteine peptidase [Blastocatellia bacterium]
ALLAGSDTPLTSGQSYRWIDKRADDGSAQYWLEDVDLGGKSTWHGPIAVSSVIEEDVPAEAPGRGRARLLSSLGADADPSGAASYNGPVEAKAKLSRVTPELLARVPNLAGAPALKLAVKQEGWYRVTQPELLAAGLDARVNPRNLQMYVDGQEVAIRVTGEKDGQFDAADAVEFYGVGLDSAASDTRIYWLAAGSGSGKRINTPAGRKGKRNPATSFPYTVERRDRTNYFTALRNGERENFFGRVVRNQPVDLSINVTHLAQGATEAAQLEVALQGVNDAPHQVSVLINGVEVGQVAYEGMTQGIARISLSNAMLLEGQNQVTLTALGSDRDVNLVDYIRLTYQHTFTADNNALRLPVSGKRKVTVGGLSTPALRVLDITDPADVAELSGKVEAQGTGYGVTFAAARAGQRTVLVVGEDRFQRPAAIAANQPSNLRDANHEADLVILTPREFFPAVEPLRAHRQGQGLAVAVVDIEDVYDEFSFGNKTPHAVRDFLAYAKDNWKKAPRFVLLGGDASFDPKNYLGRGNSDFVPTGVVDTATMETASDEWLADFTGDGLADLALGRLPARTPDEMAALVARVVGYDSAAKGENVVLVADRNDQFDFEAANAQIRALLPGDVSVTEIQRGRSDDATAKADVLQAINEGPGVVIYTGHGSTSFWRGNLLTSADAKELYNGQRLPLFVTMTCLNGYFHDPSLESLAESLMKAPGGGAIAVWASSGMTDPSVQTQMSRQLFWLLYDGSGEPLTLGEATARAKAAAGDADTRQTWILFGDPTTRLR